jgi:hypothetical protein
MPATFGQIRLKNEQIGRVSIVCILSALHRFVEMQGKVE